METDYDIEDILSPKIKQGINGGRKGKRVEREICKILTKRFGESFSRSVGSGNRWSQANLPKYARDVYSGDLVPPILKNGKHFLFCVESMGGYSGIDLDSIFIKGNKELDKFMEQVSNDSKRCGRKPLLVWKRDRQPWLAFLHTKELEGRQFKYKLHYGEWTCIALEHLLCLEDSFFFN